MIDVTEPLQPGKSSLRASPQVQTFVEQMGLHRALPHALALIRHIYPEQDAIEAELAHDPDTGERWLSLNVETPLTTEALLMRDAAFTTLWVDTLPWPERDRIAVCVLPGA